ncbi:MAG TPA: ABC transporter permease subunit, partial [Anaerolineae bacterium]|nr:ABC transporter permease subunit [Anaerolineae bacterium]
MREGLDLIRAELLKISRRKISWALLAVLVIASVLHARGLRAEFLDYRQAQETGIGRFDQGIAPEVAVATTADLARRMSFPDVLDEVWSTTDFWGLFALMILAALQAGEEFDHGTVRTLLLRGMPRGVWPAAKLVALATAAAIVWGVLAVTILPIGLWTEAQVGGNGGLSAVDVPQWGAFTGRLALSWLTTIPYMAFSIWAATAARGAGPALALGLGGR